MKAKKFVKVVTYSEEAKEFVFASAGMVGIFTLCLLPYVAVVLVVISCLFLFGGIVWLISSKEEFYKELKE